MNTKQRFKLGAGAGLVTMLLGALMVLAPVGAGAEAGGGNEDCPAGMTEVAKFNFSNNSYVEEGGPGPVTISDADGTGGTWESDVPIDVVIVKGALDAKQDLYDEATSGAFDDSDLTTPSNEQAQISNIKFCADLPSLTVSKEIDSDDAEALAATFPISVTQGEFDESDDLGHDESLPAIDPASGEYVISEDLPEDGWETPTIECTGATATGDAGGPWTVTVDDVDVTCTITNTPEAEEPEEPTLTVSKDIASTDEGALGEEFTITVEQDEAVVETSAEMGDGDSLPVIDPASGSYVISEDDLPEGWETPTIECVGATATGESGGPWTVVVDEVDVACTITNTPESDTPPPPTPSFTYGLAVEKVNDADDDDVFSDTETAESEDASVEFQITIRNMGTGALILESLEDRVFGVETIDLLEDGLLDCGTVELGVGSVLARGAVVTCTFELDEYAPAPGSSQTNTVTVVTNEATASDTSRVEVEPIEVLPTPPVTPPAPPEETPPAVTPPVETPVVTPAAEVKGVQTVRTLPRTGDETRGLAGVGAFMLALGAAMVIGSRRQLARR